MEEVGVNIECHVAVQKQKKKKKKKQPIYIYLYEFIWGCPHVKAMDCGIVVSEFVLQSRYYVHFRQILLGKV